MALAVNERADLHAWEGIYEPSEAARYLKAASHADVLYPFSSTKLIRWIRRGLANPQLVDLPGASLLIDFEDLISMRIIAALLNAGVTWPAIRRAEKWLREMTGLRQPLASEPLWMGQGEIFTEMGTRLISSTGRGQMALELIRQYLLPVNGLVFDQNSRRPTSWQPSPGVVLQPVVQFGAPCIKGTRIPTRIVAGMVEAGDSIEWVAQSYSISVTTVQAACDWESRIQSG